MRVVVRCVRWFRVSGVVRGAYFVLLRCVCVRLAHAIVF